MATTSDFEVPDFDELLGGMLDRVKEEQRPLLMAMLERVAAAKYREWSGLPEHGAHRTDLLDCAAREEEIASKVEALYAGAAALQQAIADELPELAQVSDDLFGGRSVPHQMAVLAAGERSGGRVWETLARAQSAPTAQDAMRSCGPLEDANAAVLERILSQS